jgi:hypothetical protein
MLRLEKRGNSILVGGRAVGLSFSRGISTPEPLSYGSVDDLGAHSCRGTARIGARGSGCLLIDHWEPTERGVSLRREIVVAGNGPSTAGVNVRFDLPLEPVPWKLFIPGACYDFTPVENGQGYAMVSEERTAFPLVMAFDEGTRRAVMLLRSTPAGESSAFPRRAAEGELLHATDIGGLGFDRRLSSASLAAAIPYAELPTSRMRSKALMPFMAFLPMDRKARLEVIYLVESFPAVSFDDACFKAYARACEVCPPRPAHLECCLIEYVQARMGCLASLARTWNDHTALDLNFDPRVGRLSPPSGYGTGFNRLESSVFPQILEYGFTGRQINNAFMLATCGRLWNKPDWVTIARGIGSSYLRHCATPGGFLHTLYDVVRHRPISPFGDEIGSSLHYGVRDAPSGNYVRNMAEAGYDLCLLSTVMSDPVILETASRLGWFLLRAQNRDGSWYRAHSENGQSITTPSQWFGGSDRSNKSSTSTAIPFLVRLHALTGEAAFGDAARRAGDWLLENVVQTGDYRGGTLDNPNVVDKEGMAYPMMALLDLHESTKVTDYLTGARRAGGLALTWNCLWDVPFEEGTRLRSVSFTSRGWGGISILWGTGVVDNYSLWFLPGWERLARETGESCFHAVSQLILHGTQQLLSMPGTLHGLCGPGMQEEGFACSHQGIDDGLIRKGDTWGALGWVFAAGTYGVWNAIDPDDRLNAHIDS